MPADTFQVKYDEMEQVGSKFQDQSQTSQEVLDKIKSAMQPLENGGWIGRGSDAFFQEMNSEVLPALTRLVHALAEGSSASKKIAQISKQHEDEASAAFRQMVGG